MSRELDAILHFSFLTLALVLWFLKKPGGRNHYTFPLGLFLIATFTFDGMAVLIMFNKYLAHTLNSNLFLYHFLTPIQFFFILLIYKKVFISGLIRKMLPVLSIVFLLVSLIFSLFIQPLREYNSYTILIKHVLVITIVLSYFLELIKKTPFVKIYSQPIFWISIGFFFHATFNVLLEGTSNYFKTYSTPIYSILYTLYSVSNYILFILLSIGILNLHSPYFKNSEPDSNK